MKHFSFPVLLFLVFAFNLSAQNFPLQGNEKWAYNQWQTASLPPGGCTIDTWKFFELRGDTLLGSQKWFRLFQASYVEIYCSFPSSHTETFAAPAPNGFLRDSANFWFFRASENAPPELLFHFNHAVGEPFFQTGNCKVDQISETSATPPRKVESQEPPMFNSLATRLIEGAGSAYSFFFPACFDCFSSDCQFAVFLKCFRQNGVEVPLDLAFDCAKSDIIFQKILDSSPTAEPSDGQNAALVLMPNPAFDKIKIEWPGEISGGGFQVEMFDLNGKRLLSEASVSSPELDISGLAAGVYVVRVLDLKNGGTVLGRFYKI